MLSRMDLISTQISMLHCFVAMCNNNVVVNIVKGP